MVLRQKVLTMYGHEVVACLDEYATVMHEQHGDYEVGRKDRTTSQEARLQDLKQQLVNLKGPIATHRIHVASTADRERLVPRLDDWHDIDDVLREFAGDTRVILDSESGEMFVHAHESATQEVIGVLTANYPDISWIAKLQSLSFSYISVIGNWPQAQQWLLDKYATA